MDKKPLKRKKTSDHSEINIEECFIEPARDPRSPRERGRLRSKSSRNRKKAYIQGLEQKISHLKSENFRLQNLLISYRNDKFEIIGKEPVSFVQKQVSHKIISYERLLSGKAPDSGKPHKYSIYEDFMENSWNCYDQHKEFLENSFRLIINHCVPHYPVKFWKDLDERPLKEYEVILKHSKLTKYQIPEFEAEHEFTNVDRLCSSMKPKRPQYKFFRKVLQKEFELKKKYRKGIQSLLQAKQIFDETNSDLLLFLRFLFSSKIVPDAQILESNFSEDYKSKDDAFHDIWNIQVKKKGFIKNIDECPLFKNHAKRSMKKCDREFITDYNYFHLPE